MALLDFVDLMVDLLRLLPPVLRSSDLFIVDCCGDCFIFPISVGT